MTATNKLLQYDPDPKKNPSSGGSSRLHHHSLTICFLMLNPTLDSILSMVVGWKRVISVEMYSVRRSHDTFLAW